MICIFASEQGDFKTLLEKSEIISEERFGKGIITKALLHGEKVLFVATGYNKVNLGLSAGYVLEKYKIDTIIGLGNCGYLGNGQLKAGDIAISSSAVQYSVNSTAIGYPDTVIPGVGLGVFPCSTKLINLAQESCKKLNYGYLTGKIATAETFVADNHERNLIASKYTSQFIDMECGSSAQISYIYGIPAVFIKGVSNFANNNASSDYNNYSAYANTRACDVVYCMLQCLGEKCDDMSCAVNLSNFKRLSESEIRAVIDESSYVNLGLSENNQPYIVPMCFDACSCNLCSINLYSPSTGKKMTCIDNNNKVSLEFVIYTPYGYKSVVAFGRAKIVDTGVHKMCNNFLTKIAVTIDSISGREYFDC